TRHAKKGDLRAHLRSCSACSTSARRLRARASRLGRLSGLLFPWGIFKKLSSLFGGSSASSAVVVKTALVVSTAGIVGGAAVETGLLNSSPSRPPVPVVKAPQAARQLTSVDGKPAELKRTVAKRAQAH